MLGRMAGAAGSRAGAGSRVADLVGFTGVDFTRATGSTAMDFTPITLARSTAIDSAGEDSLADFTHILGGVITAPIRPGTTLT
jgi:hypothetical protein